MTEIIITFVCDFTKKFKDEEKDGREKYMEETEDEVKGENLEKIYKKQTSFNEIKDNIKDHGEKDTKIVVESENDKIQNKSQNFDQEIFTQVNTGKPVQFLHIEYNLFPGKIVNKIDIVFWGTIAKIYTNTETKAIKSMNRDDHCWVAFSIKHKIVLGDTDAEVLKNHKIQFSVTTNKSKLVFGEAKKDAEKTFYFKREAIENGKIFAEAFETDPNLEEIVQTDRKTQNKIDVQYILDKLLNFPTETESLSILQIPYNLHVKKVVRISERISQNELVPCLNDLDEPIDVEELIATKKAKGDKKKSKKDKAEKGNTYDSSEITFPGELCFTDPTLATYNLKLKNNDLNNAFALIGIKRLLNERKNKELNPLIIKIQKLTNIPSDLLKEHRYSYLYITYSICDIDHNTGARSIGEQIDYSDNHVYFVPERQVDKLAQVIQNGFLVFQVHGIRVTPPKKGCSMFGENAKDKLIGIPINRPNEVRKYIEGDIETNKKSVLLAISRIRLTDLLSPCWQLKVEARCIHPKNLEKHEFYNKITINEMMIENLELFDQNPLTERILISSGMSIHVAVQLLHPIGKILDDLIEAKQYYNRLIIQVLDISLAKRIFFNLFVHNAHWSQRKNIVPPFLSRRDESILDVYEKNLVTGFGIDCVDHSILFVEGHKKWIWNLFWKSTLKEKIADIKLIYNSDHIYDKRLYSSLIPYGGVYFICMHVSPYQLLICSSTYVKGDIPESSRRALHKLDMLRKSTQMKELPDNMLPTLKELFGLSNEWGVPMHWPLEKKYSQMYVKSYF